MDWIFPPNNYGAISGIGDAGIATFANTMYESLVREAIQNSLDARAEDAIGPVEVEFCQDKIDIARLPGKESLVDALSRCAMAKSNDDKTTHFFTSAKRQLTDNSSLRVLRVSDYNTVGLTGGLSGEVSSSWSRLVKESGTSNKAGVSGGSFGIGKSAYFACSMLRTVFISSLSQDGEKSNVGVARLISFELDDDKGLSAGTGYYANRNGLTALNELASFDDAAHRTRPGTDIFILQNFLLNDGSSIKNRLIDSVISNFLVSILKNLLVVRVQEVLVDSNYVDEYFNLMMAKPKDSLSQNSLNLLNYYLTLRNPDGKTLIISLDSSEYGEEFGFQGGECELMIRKGSDNSMNRRVMMTRKTGMRLFEQSNISSNIYFTGILYISGAKMNRMFRSMETPAHDKWVPSEQDSNYKEQETAYRKLRDYIRQKVAAAFEDRVGDEVDAFDVGQFLPDILGKSAEGDAAGTIVLQEKDVKISDKKVKPSKKKVRRTNALKGLEEGKSGISEEPAEDTGTGKGEGKGAFGGDGENPGPARGTGDEDGSGKRPDEDGSSSVAGSGSESGEEEIEKLHFREVETSARTICINPEAGLYHIVLRVPSKARHARLEFTISGEQDDEDLLINEVNVASDKGKTRLASHKGNAVVLEDLIKNDTIRLTVQVDFIGHCMMEVDYLESKK